MTPEIAICLTILGLAVIAFAWDRVPADVVALGVMLGVIATGLLPPDKAFAGFGSDTVMMILGLLVMSAGLIQTGVVEIAGRYVFDLAGRNPAIFLPVIMVSVAVRVGLHEQYRGDRLLRAAGDRLRRQDRRQPVAASCCRWRSLRF